MVDSDGKHKYMKFTSRLDAENYTSEEEHAKDGFVLMPWVDYDVERVSMFKYWRVYIKC